MTSREKEILKIVKTQGGDAHPTTIGREMGITGDYAEQLCRDMVWMGYFIKKGLRYGLAPEGHLKKR
ncbi:MAG: hypothetical protein ACE5IH_10010 [Thermodesulfobacteriota bacterium]